MFVGVCVMIEACAWHCSFVIRYLMKIRYLLSKLVQVDCATRSVCLYKDVMKSV